MKKHHVEDISLHTTPYKFCINTVLVLFSVAKVTKMSQTSQKSVLTLTIALIIDLRVNLFQAVDLFRSGEDSP